MYSYEERFFWWIKFRLKIRGLVLTPSGSPLLGVYSKQPYVPTPRFYHLFFCCIVLVCPASGLFLLSDLLKHCYWVTNILFCFGKLQTPSGAWVMLTCEKINKRNHFVGWCHGSRIVLFFARKLWSLSE